MVVVILVLVVVVVVVLEIMLGDRPAPNDRGP